MTAPQHISRELTQALPGIVEVHLKDGALHLLFDTRLKWELEGESPQAWRESMRKKSLQVIEFFWNAAVNPDATRHEPTHEALLDFLFKQLHTFLTTPPKSTDGTATGESA